MLVPHDFATHLSRAVELFRDPQAKAAQKAQFRALLVLLKLDAVTLRLDGGRLVVNGTAVEGAAFDPLRRHLKRHAVGELTIPADPPAGQLFELLKALAVERTEPLDLGADGILHGESLSDMSSLGAPATSVPEVTHDVPPTPASPAPVEPASDAAAAPDPSPIPIKGQSPEALLAELERHPRAMNSGDVLMSLAQQIDAAVRANRIELALKLMTGVLRCERSVPEENRRGYGIALKRMFTRGLLEGVAHLAQQGGHHPDVIAVLQRSGADGVEVLLDLLVGSPTMEERAAIFATLTKMKEGLEQAIHLIDHHQWFVVRNIAELVGELGLEAAVPHLGRQLEHPDERVRKSVALALAKVGSRSAAEPLRRALKDDSREVRIQAALGVGGRKASALAMPLVVALEEEEDEEVERELILALGRIGSPDAVQALIKFAQPSGRLFSRKPAGLRLAAVEALRLAATPAAVGTLQGLVDDGDKQVRGAAVVALAQMKKR
jgi:HEAT repeat protein/PBS lyase HEAT-like repeat-containing protein